LKIYLDDRRRPYDKTWYKVETVDQAIDALQNNSIQIISLDHDLGACDDCMEGMTPEEWLIKHNNLSMPHCNHYGTGYDVLCWLEEQIMTNNYPAPVILVHTANPSARQKMLQAVERIDDYIAQRNNQTSAR